MTAIRTRRLKKNKFKIYLSFIVALIIPILIFINITKAAGDTSQSWDFSNSGDYNLGDANGIEVSGSTAKLKVQNYTSDANTMGLYHFDEASGSTADDASSYSNDATVTGGTFSAGNLNNALTLSGNQTYATVPDSASLSLTQSNTIEAWVKFNNSFSPYSAYQRQVIVDKGDY
jgi:hypothetical protein